MKGFSVKGLRLCGFRDVTEHLCLVEYLFSRFKGLLELDVYPARSCRGGTVSMSRLMEQDPKPLALNHQP